MEILTNEEDRDLILTEEEFIRMQEISLNPPSPTKAMMELKVKYGKSGMATELIGSTH